MSTAMTSGAVEVQGFSQSCPRNDIAACTLHQGLEALFRFSETAQPDTGLGSNWIKQQTRARKARLTLL